MIRLDVSRAAAPDDTMIRQAEKAVSKLLDSSGMGDDPLGWLHLPSSTGTAQLEPILRAAEKIRRIAEVVVVAGIGGSYLGTKAVNDALAGSFEWQRKGRRGPYLLYAGTNLSEDYAYELLEALEDRPFGVVAVSKSGSTMEPAIAFRFLRAELERRYGKDGARERVAVVTSTGKGALEEIAGLEGYDTFAVANDIGGRYSVFSPAGLLPLAIAGADIKALIEGAAIMEDRLCAAASYDSNIAAQYAAVRNSLYFKGFKTEILGVYEPRLRAIGEWWKQLFGESEGKQGKGIFPACVEYTTDLHSMGQYIQQGERTLFETIISIDTPQHRFIIGSTENDCDGLNYLAGRRLGEVNRMAELAAATAHEYGGVPNIRLSIECADARNIGGLLYFFKFACALSGYMLGINPFDQPGVEEYKRNMVKLLAGPTSDTGGEK